MRTFLAILLFSWSSFSTVWALPAAESGGYLTGKIVSVKGQATESPAYQFGSGNPSDAPLTSQYYSYEVAIRVSCGLYIGRYDSPVDYLPASLRENNVVAVYLTKHHMFFDLPGYQHWEMNIVHKKVPKGHCAAQVNTH